MIAANELRIGNYVYSNEYKYDFNNKPATKTLKNKSTIVVDSINGDDKKGVNLYISWGYEDYEITSFENLEGIPLTPELLIKCGFEECDWNEYYRFYELKDIMVAIHKTNVSIFVTWESVQVDCYLNNFYIHQLQNLYFAFTGEELNIEL